VKIWAGWTASDIPDLTGRRAVVTGASSGLGLETATVLAAHGAQVLLAARDAGKGDDAVRRVRAQVPGASVQRGSLDLADLASVRAFADRVGDRPLDLLVNNAGVMAVPPRHTADGFELQMGTNHLGHFALTGLLLPALLACPVARVVTVSSYLHWFGSLDFGDLMSERSYDPWRAYASSKLANLLFVRELDRRARDAGVDLVSVGAHPGYARTNLVAAGPATGRPLTGAVLRLGTALVGQSARAGALPQLRAATDPEARGGEYFGPRGPAEQRGLPKRVRCSANARDDRAASLLWVESERLTGVVFHALAAVPG
jgi:NAD(P)-dependent dehydrogenase (short-subunit alcohol dehydrogenase family)